VEEACRISVERTIRHGRAAAVACAFVAMIGDSPALAGGSSKPTIVYVDDDAKPGGDGSSWSTAFRYLQDALAVAGTGDEVRIAQGTYRTDQGEGYTIGDDEVSFTFYNGLALRGGYAGLTGPDPDQRDFELYPTVLNGELFDDQGNLLGITDCMIMAVAVVEPLKLEGLVIRRGWGGVQLYPADFNFDSGGGLFAQASALEISDCTFTDNRAMRGGGAFLTACADTIVERCKFTVNNSCRKGAGMMIKGIMPGHSVTITNCLFQDQNNASQCSDQRSGGLHIELGESDPDPVIQGCDFINNEALAINGGAGSLQGTSGSAFLTTPLRGIYINCNFVGNSADDVGGVSAKMLINCHVFGNSGGFSAGGAAAETCIGTTFELNSAPDWGGGALWACGDVINCQFLHNWTYWENDGGGAIMVRKPARIVNCLFNQNTVANPPYGIQGDGHAVRVWFLAVPTIFSNCTFVNNGLDGTGATVVGTADARNCIFWNNNSTNLVGAWNVWHSCVQGGWSGPGGGNIDGDPLFVDFAGPDQTPGTPDDDLRLSEQSPCLDAGDDSAWPSDMADADGDGDLNEPLPLDFGGTIRFSQQGQIADTGIATLGLPPIDIGCYERPALGDLTGDGWVNIDDLLQLLDSWGVCISTECSADIAPPGAGNGMDGGDGQIDVDDFLMLLLNWS
jgi:hypothetical protein